MRSMASIIREMQQYQQLPYSLNTNETIQQFILNAPVCTEKELYNHSLLREEKMGRSASISRASSSSTLGARKDSVRGGRKGTLSPFRQLDQEKLKRKASIQELFKLNFSAKHDTA